MAGFLICLYHCSADATFKNFELIRIFFFLGFFKQIKFFRIFFNTEVFHGWKKQAQIFKTANLLYCAYRYCINKFLRFVLCMCVLYALYACFHAPHQTVMRINPLTNGKNLMACVYGGPAM